MHIIAMVLVLVLLPIRSQAADTLWSAMIVGPGRWGWTVIGGSASVTITDNEISFVIKESSSEYFDGRLFKGRIKKEGTITKIFDVQSVEPTSGTAIGRPYEGTMDYIYPQTIEGEVHGPDSQHIQLINEFRFIGLTRHFAKRK